MYKTQASGDQSASVMPSRMSRQTRRRADVWLVPNPVQDDATHLANQAPQVVGALALVEAPVCEPVEIKAPAHACVLIVEDDPHVAGLLRRAFELEGQAHWSVDIIPSGRAALMHVQETAPSIVLLDVALPDIDGAEVYRRLRANPQTQSCPVVFLTASTSHDLSVRGVDGGVLLRKPYDVEQVIMLVTALLQEM